MQPVASSKFAFASVIALSCFVFAQEVSAATYSWNGTGSTNTADFTLNTNWAGNVGPIAGGTILISDGGNHNPVMNSAVNTSVMFTASGPSSPTGPISLTGTGTLTMNGNTTSSYISNSANSNFTVDIGNLNVTGRGTYLVSGDYSTVAADAGSGSLILGHAGGPMTITYTVASGSTANQPVIQAHNVGGGTVGTNVIIYPKLDFSGVTGTSTSSFMNLQPESLGTIQLLGGITGGASPTNGNPTRSLRTNGSAGGKVVLGDSTGWKGFTLVNASDLEITSSNSLGTTDGYTEIASGAGTGALRLNGGGTPIV